MILIENPRHRAAGAVAGVVLLAALASAAAAGPLVVRASGPTAASFKPGQRLPDAPLVLKAGDMVTVLDKAGTRNFSGPGSFDFAAASQAAAPIAFAELLTQKPERRARIGAVRGVGVEPAAVPVPPGVWAVDAASGGTVCALDTARISVWRADPTLAATLRLTRVADGKSADVGFAAGQATANWPQALQPVSGDRFTVGGGAKIASLTIRQIPAAPDSIDALGAALMENGCQSQFDRLVRVAAKASG